MKRSKTTNTKHNKKQKLSKDLNECKIIDTIENIKQPKGIIQTPCGKFLIGIEGHSIYKYCLETKQKFRIAGSVDLWGHQDGTRDKSIFYLPQCLTLSKDCKTLFVSDVRNRVIRAICVGTGVTITFAGKVGIRKSIDGPKEKACFIYPRNFKLTPDGNTLLVSDLRHLCSICIATEQVRTICTFENDIYDFIFSPDGKHIYIFFGKNILKYNIETCKFEIVLEEKGYTECDISKDSQLLFISSRFSKEIVVVNLDTTQVIGSINTPFEPFELKISTNGKQLYVVYYFDRKIQVFDISKYCTNFKTFIQLQLSKHSFLPLQVINSFSI
jgi:DNA-binding beta-propeller fold protein YncE